jgi:AcrR family transcriptional regulator
VSPRTVDRDARRAQLVDAAAKVFAQKGVRETAISDIVRTAGVAQGTFYLYFGAKEDVIVAVTERVADHIVDGLVAKLGDPGRSAVERFEGFTSVLADLSRDDSLTKVAEFIHRRENQALHDRLDEHLIPRLFTLMEQLVTDGVADGSFEVDDPSTAAWFVLGGLRGLELAGTPLDQLGPALATAAQLALRTLGARQ